MTEQGRLSQLAEEAAALDFLVSVFTDLPDEAMVQAAMGAGASAAGGPAGDELAAWSREQGGREAADVLLDIARDRVVLMRGVYEGGVKPPYESLWADSDAPSSIAAVNRFCAAAGLEPTGEVRDAPDQLGVELSVLSALVRREADALGAGDADAADAARAQRGYFEREHVGRWAGAYARAMREAASTGFYRAVALMLEEMFPGGAGKAN